MMKNIQMNDILIKVLIFDIIQRLIFLLITKMKSTQLSQKHEDIFFFFFALKNI